MEKGLPIPRLKAGCLADIGLGRDHQEDCIGYASLYEHPAYFPLARQRGNLYVLSDGAGGHQAGDMASEIAVLGTLTLFYRQTNAGIEEALLEAVHEASYRIGHYAANAGISARATLVCAVIRGNELCMTNVGDSRAYLIRNGRATQLSEDHTLVAQWMREGQITIEQAKQHAYRNVLTQALGGTEEVQPSVHWEEVLPGDEILLCSDGLHGVVDNSTIARIVSRATDPQVACEQLIDLANDAGGPDNISIVIIQIEHVDFYDLTQPSGEGAVTPPLVFERGDSGVITLRTNAQDSPSKHQANPRHGILDRLSAKFDR